MRSEQINELAAALSKAQGEMKNAPFDKKNPHFGSAYASLASVRDTVREPLAKHGLSVTQTLEDDRLVTTLMHASGQWVESSCRMPQSAKAQEIGSYLSYMRRYSLSALLNISADSDDDGNDANNIPPAGSAGRANAPKASSDGEKRSHAAPAASTPAPRAPVVAPKKPESTPDVNRSKVMAAAQSAGWAPESVTRYIDQAYGVKLVRDLTSDQVEYLIKVIKAKNTTDAMAALGAAADVDPTSFDFGANAPTRIGS
jgi:hypothetical protein